VPNIPNGLGASKSIRSTFGSTKVVIEAGRYLLPARSR
jgi:hypothetical protein